MANDSQTAKAAFEAGKAAFEAGDRSAAEAHFSRALQADPDHAAALHGAGGLAFLAGRFRDAVRLLDAASRLAPENADIHADIAMAHSRLDDLESALRHAERAVFLAPHAPQAYALLAQLRLPGPPYLEVIARLHAHLQPRTYLEIGVSTGQSIALARPETRAIGIDPSPQIRMPLAPCTTIRAATSDDYFARHDVSGDLGGLPIDLAFVAGVHQFELALRDFINIEKHCSAQSTILIHDCYPLSRLTAEREQRSVFWSGDVWRLILVLRKCRPELGVNVVATAPTGLAVVRGLNPQSGVLQKWYEEIVREHLALDYSVLEADQAGMLALYPNDWERIKALLA